MVVEDKTVIEMECTDAFEAAVKHCEASDEFKLVRVEKTSPISPWKPYEIDGRFKVFLEAVQNFSKIAVTIRFVELTRQTTEVTVRASMSFWVEQTSQEHLEDCVRDRLEWIGALSVTKVSEVAIQEVMPETGSDAITKSEPSRGGAVIPVADEIKKLHELVVQGILTDEEFAQAKTALLDTTVVPTQPREASLAGAEIREVLQEHEETKEGT